MNRNTTFGVFQFTNMNRKSQLGFFIDAFVIRLPIITTQTIRKKNKILMNYPKQLLNLMIIAYFWPIQPWLDHDGPLPMRPGGHYQH